jgi:hypothetical protein
MREKTLILNQIDACWQQSGRIWTSESAFAAETDYDSAAGGMLA